MDRRIETRKLKAILMGLATIALIALASLPAVAQTSPKPTVPEFSLKYVEHPYDVPPTTTVDPYTGKTITHQGYRVENNSLEIKIRNQPYKAHLSNGSVVHLYYNVRYKGSYGNENDWKALYVGMQNWPTQTDGEYTILTPQTNPSTNLYFPSPSSVDFQVRALIGNVNLINGRLWGANDYYVFDGIEGEWSNTQTLNLDNKSTTTAPQPQLMPAPTATVKPNQNPQATPTQPASEAGVVGVEFLVAALAVAVGVIAVLAGTIVVLWRKRKS